MLALVTLAAHLSAFCSAPNEDPKKALDFWLGSWEVRTTSEHIDGHDKVETLLGGSAILENWRDSEGNEGKSFFYYTPAKKRWTQVWVTPAGVYKEKYSAPVPNGIRFTGHVYLPDGRSFDDRTTLLKMTGGRVHQIIELSRDKGRTWKTTFDATYSRAEGVM